MPILDLLASITGEKPSASPTPVSRPSPILGKRKADDELRSTGPKAARPDAVTQKVQRPNGNSPRPSPRLADRPLGTPGDKQAPKPQPTSEKKRLDERSGVNKPNARSSTTPATVGSKPLPPRLAGNRPNVTDSGPPKKRSYAEIMARAKANSEQRESLGKIQHKTVERNMTMKERKEMKVEEVRQARMGARKLGNARSRPGAVNVSRKTSPSVSTNAKTIAPAEPKKVKKAALATTGYTGTARPRPGASTATKAGGASRSGSETRSRDRSRYGGPLSSGSRNRYDEDDDMDDFIVDDEEEEQEPNAYGARYRYDSYDDESDMEAGMTDIEDEEQLAERQARREDLEQEALEKRLKLEKEERRRRFLETTKSKAGGR